jgi:tetraacyldisaccharide 4'-kinase
VEARAIGERARQCAESKRGASARAAREVRERYESGLPKFLHSLPVRIFGWPAQRAWLFGARTKRRQARRLGVRTISVGNLSMGGTGKTPCVLRVAELLKGRGGNPGILTRGYGRVSPEKMLTLGAGAAMPTYHTGDEPQIFLRSGVAPVGIGGDRFAAGAELIRKFHSDSLILDDGFQHSALARDLDIVLIDALNPVAGGGVFPLGRLREPFSAIARADVVVITRADFSDLAPAIERAIRRWNNRAPIFCANFRPREWVSAASGERYPPDRPPFRRAGAFCGLGNPQSFRRTLAQLGVEPVGWEEFEDHHRYRTRELQSLMHGFGQLGADAMATTEKDAVNLPELAAELPVYFLRIAMEIEREEEFLRAIESN